jgi:DNA-binding LacI/PurR family transcriptional regulator
MAELTIRTAQEHGLRVPEDLSVTGFDSVLPSRLRETKPLTTVAMPLEEIGAEAVRLVHWRLEHPNVPRRTVVLECSVIPGETVGPVASDRSRATHPVVRTNG